MKDSIRSLRNEYKRNLNWKVLPCQFEITCTKGTVFYRTGIMTMILANNVLIKSSQFEKRHYDSGGVS